MHVMLDLETLGQSPRAIVLEIAAVEFDPRQGGVILQDQAFDVHVDINDQRDREFEKSTVLWWMQQPEAAVQRIVTGQLGATSLRIALWRLRVWMRARDVQGLWAKNMAFDVGILRDCFASLGEGHDIPWHYRLPRDLRSYFAPRDPPKVSFQGTEHSAVDDCVHQIRQLQTGWRG